MRDSVFGSTTPTRSSDCQLDPPIETTQRTQNDPVMSGAKCEDGLPGSIRIASELTGTFRHVQE